MAQALTDNFESYNIAELAGQGNWTAQNGNGFFSVTNSNPNSGSQCVHQGSSVPANNGYYKSTDSNLAIGSETFYLALKSLQSNTDLVGVYFYSAAPAGTDPSSNEVFRIYFFQTGAGVYKISVDAHGSNPTDILTGQTESLTYRKIDVSWDNTVPNVNFKIDGANSTTIGTGAFASITKIGIVWSGSVGTNEFYIDDFGGVTTTTKSHLLSLLGTGS